MTSSIHSKCNVYDVRYRFIFRETRCEDIIFPLMCRIFDNVLSLYDYEYRFDQHGKVFLYVDTF